MVDAAYQGYSRFCYMEKLRKEVAYKSIHGGESPGEKVCRTTLVILPDDVAATFRTINKELLAIQAKSAGFSEATADFHDSAITVFGNHERSTVGYNPKYHGRPSYKEKVGVISGTKELVDLTLEEGSNHNNY